MLPARLSTLRQVEACGRESRTRSQVFPTCSPKSFLIAVREKRWALYKRLCSNVELLTAIRETLREADKRLFPIESSQGKGVSGESSSLQRVSLGHHADLESFSRIALPVEKADAAQNNLPIQWLASFLAELQSSYYLLTLGGISLTGAEPRLFL